MRHFHLTSSVHWSSLWAPILALVLLAGCSQQRTLPLADENLRPVESGSFDHVLVPAGERLPRFTQIYIETPEIHFSDRWLREHRRDYTERDLERIQTTFGDMLKGSLTRGLEANTGVTVTDSAEDAEVIFRPQLRALNIYAPDLSATGIRTAYTRQAGNATFDLVLLDPEERVLGQFIDHRETRHHAGRAMERTNRATNNRHFRRLMDRWSFNLTTYLLIAGAVPEVDDGIDAD